MAYKDIEKNLEEPVLNVFCEYLPGDVCHAGVVGPSDRPYWDGDLLLVL